MCDLAVRISTPSFVRTREREQSIYFIKEISRDRLSFQNFATGLHRTLYKNKSQDEFRRLKVRLRR